MNGRATGRRSDSCRVFGRACLDQEFDGHAAGRDPMVSTIGAEAVAIADGAVVNDEAALAVARPAGPLPGRPCLARIEIGGYDPAQ